MSKALKVVFVAYVHNTDTFNAMSRGSKEALTVLIVTHITHVKRVESGVCGLCTQYRYIQCYVKRVERVKRLCYVHSIDTFNIMLKGSKGYVLLKQGTNTLLLITFLIFNQFLIWKKFWKAETLTFQTIPSNAMYVEGVKSYFDFWPVQHTSTDSWAQLTKHQSHFKFSHSNHKTIAVDRLSLKS